MNIYETAMKTEADAIDFYASAAQKTQNPIGKKMFQSIVEDEKRHLEIMECLFKRMHVPHGKISPMERVKTVFEENRGLMLQRVTATSDDIEALAIAMRMEQESVDFYRKAAKDATDPKEKEIFERLVAEETEHYTIFSNTHNFLVDSGNWFMWKEYSIVDGGTATA
ncbi:MAG: ferritin family protein [Actinomycetota bacterium]|nr:ferritin family protein [Actinomycetota bacterium]